MGLGTQACRLQQRQSVASAVLSRLLSDAAVYQRVKPSAAAAVLLTADKSCVVCAPMLLLLLLLLLQVLQEALSNEDDARHGPGVDQLGPEAAALLEELRERQVGAWCCLYKLLLLL